MSVFLGTGDAYFAPAYEGDMHRVDFKTRYVGITIYFQNIFVDSEKFSANYMSEY